MSSEEHAERGMALDQLHSQIGRLKIGLALLVFAWGGTAIWMVSQIWDSPDVLSIERLDIVEPDGELAFVLANSKRGVPATVDGQVLLDGHEEERDMPTFVFFDGQGDEVGGMLFLNRETEDGFHASRHISLDAYKQDQTVVLSHYQNPEGASSGLRISDKPDVSILEATNKLGLEPSPTRKELENAIQARSEEKGEQALRDLLGVNRLFLGSNWENEATLVLRDGSERPRILLGVPENGEPYIRVLDEDGEPLLEVP